MAITDTLNLNAQQVADKNPELHQMRQKFFGQDYLSDIQKGDTGTVQYYTGLGDPNAINYTGEQTTQPVVDTSTPVVDTGGGGGGGGDGIMSTAPAMDQAAAIEAMTQPGAYDIPGTMPQTPVSGAWGPMDYLQEPQTIVQDPMTGDASIAEAIAAQDRQDAFNQRYDFEDAKGRGADYMQEQAPGAASTVAGPMDYLQPGYPGIEDLGTETPMGPNMADVAGLGAEKPGMLGDEGFSNLDPETKENTNMIAGLWDKAKGSATNFKNMLTESGKFNPMQILSLGNAFAGSGGALSLASGLGIPGMIIGALSKAGTQVSPEQKAANAAFEQEHGIEIGDDGRITSGPLAGTNPAGKSFAGSATYDEMIDKKIDSIKTRKADQTPASEKKIAELEAMKTKTTTPTVTKGPMGDEMWTPSTEETIDDTDLMNFDNLGPFATQDDVSPETTAPTGIEGPPSIISDPFTPIGPTGADVHGGGADLGTTSTGTTPTDGGLGDETGRRGGPDVSAPTTIDTTPTTIDTTPHHTTPTTTAFHPSQGGSGGDPSPPSTRGSQDMSQGQTGMGSCFIAGTKVRMADGTDKNIEDVIVGDTVKGQKGNNKVIALDPTLLGDRKLYSFNDNEHYFFTSEHPFMTEEGWKSIKPEKTKERDGVELYDQLKGELKVGDKLVTDSGLVNITEIKSKEMNDPEMPLYNFHISNDNSYIADDYVVHNKGGDGGGKIVCTMMNNSYGFGSFRNKIWLKHSKTLPKEYQIGYHKIFLPLVKLSKKNIVLKKILEHIAIHRTIDIRQEARGKTHILGRIYRKILEPICYWVGKNA